MIRYKIFGGIRFGIPPYNGGSKRWGGEEFLLLLTDTKLKPATEHAERLRLAIASGYFPAKNDHISITASFGVAELNDAIKLNTLIDRADEKLYQAKAQGRNKVCFNLLRAAKISCPI